MKTKLREILKRLYDRGYCDGSDCLVPADLEEFTFVFDQALSEILDLIEKELVPKNIFGGFTYDEGSHSHGYKDGWNKCRQEILNTLKRWKGE